MHPSLHVSQHFSPGIFATFITSESVDLHASPLMEVNLLLPLNNEYQRQQGQLLQLVREAGGLLMGELVNVVLPQIVSVIFFSFFFFSRYPQQEQLNSAAPSHPAFPHLHPHPYPYPQAPTAQGQNQYHPASASLAPQHAHQHQGQQQQLQQQQQQRPSLDFFASALQRPEPLKVFSAQGAREASPAFAPPRSDKEEVIHRFFASQPASDGPAMLSPKRRDPTAKTRERPPGRGSKQGVFLPPIMSSTQKSAEIGDFLSVDSRQEFAPLVPDASSPRGGEGDDSDDGGDARREEERGGAANRVMFAEGGDNELALHSPLGKCRKERASGSRSALRVPAVFERLKNESFNSVSRWSFDS